jgi:hypothetical protein
MPLRPGEQETREIEIKGTLIKFTNADVEWPASQPSYSNRVPDLFQDWEDSALVKLKGVPVPLKYWGQLFSRVNPDSWRTMKKDFSEWKVCFLMKFALHAYY